MMESDKVANKERQVIKINSSFKTAFFNNCFIMSCIVLTVTLSGCRTINDEGKLLGIENFNFELFVNPEHGPAVLSSEDLREVLNDYIKNWGPSDAMFLVKYEDHFKSCVLKSSINFEAEPIYTSTNVISVFPIYNETMFFDELQRRCDEYCLTYRYVIDQIWRSRKQVRYTSDFVDRCTIYLDDKIN